MIGDGASRNDDAMADDIELQKEMVLLIGNSLL
jgi:hypothetical protein